MIEITSLDHYGRGIGKINNKIVFVKNALPGEIVEIIITEEKKNYTEAKCKSIIKKADNRIESKCPHFNSCGGCDILHMNYPTQLKFKQDKINNIINKFLNTDIDINNIIHCDNNFNYRNKTTFQVKENLGFYKNKSYDIIPIEKCLISNELINKAIPQLKKIDLKYIEKIICRATNNELMVILDSTKDTLNIEVLKEVASSIYIKCNNKYRLIYGKEYIIEKLDNYTYLISPDSFFQININVCLKLYRKIKEYVGTNKNVLDLYCGTGSIGIFVSENNNVLGVEINEYAIKDAIKNAKLNNIQNIKFICEDSGKALKNIKFKPDIIIVDPPRSGLSKETIENIFKINPQKLIYVSCDPMTLARDLNIINKKYKIIELTPFDMFPNTKHVECLVYLENKQISNITVQKN